METPSTVCRTQGQRAERRGAAARGPPRVSAPGPPPLAPAGTCPAMKGKSEMLQYRGAGSSAPLKGWDWALGACGREAARLGRRWAGGHGGAMAPSLQDARGPGLTGALLLADLGFRTPSSISVSFAFFANKPIKKKIKGESPLLHPWAETGGK